MQQELPFDPDVYFAMAANIMIRQLGDEALLYADMALENTKVKNNQSGVYMWTEIRKQVEQKSQLMSGPAVGTIH